MKIKNTFGVWGNLNAEKIEGMTEEQLRQLITEKVRAVCHDTLTDADGNITYKHMPVELRKYHIATRHLAIDCHYDIKARIIATFTAKRKGDNITLTLDNYEYIDNPQHLTLT